MDIDTAMDIEDMDFTPALYFYSDRCNNEPIVSMDECILIGNTHFWMSGGFDETTLGRYLNQLVTYYQRFNTHMPVPIRVSLLRGIKSS